MGRWLKDAEKDVWRTAFILIAKNYYVEVNTEQRSNDDVTNYRNGWFEFSIKQRKELFQVKRQVLYLLDFVTRLSENLRFVKIKISKNKFTNRPKQICS